MSIRRILVDIYHKVKKDKYRYIFLILVLATLLRFIGLYPNIAHPDEGYVQVVSWNIVRDFLQKGDLNPHTYKYGSFIFLTQAVFYLPVLIGTYLSQNLTVFISSNFTSKFMNFATFHEEAVRRYGDLLTIFGRAEVALLGVGTIYIVYLIGKKLFNKNVGLLSAFFLAIYPLHVRDSHYITTDIPFIFFLMLAFYLVLKTLEKRSLKNYILSGFFLGFSSTIRFFPMGLLIYPFLVIYTFKKTREWVIKSIISLLAIPVGVIAGMPFFLIDPKAPQILASDFARYISPWYQTSISNYIFALAKGHVLNPSTLIPPFFKGFYGSYIIFSAVTPVLTLFALLGIVLLLRKSFKKFLILIVIPLFTFIYISCYVPATYERLVLPILPFLAIFGGYFVENLKKYKTAAIIFTILGIFPALLSSGTSSVACGNQLTMVESQKWVDEHIPLSAKIAKTTPVGIPSTKTFAGDFNLEPGKVISFADVQNIGYDYAFINTSRLDYVTYRIFGDYFIVPPSVFENSYYSLIMAEYFSRAKLLGTVTKPPMCDVSRIYYFKMPEELVGQKKVISSPLLINHPLSSQYDTPRMVSGPIGIESGKTYFFTASVKSKDNSQTPQEIFLRMDYYNPKPNNVNTFLTKLWQKLRIALLFIQEGSSPIFFEKERLIRQISDDPKFPGQVVALSPLSQVSDKKTKIVVSAQAPVDAKYATFSISGNFSNNINFSVDDLAYGEIVGK